MQVTSCPSCNSQYNTAHMQSGAQFQCSNCGAMVLVQAAAPQMQQPMQQQPMQQQAQPVQRRASMPQAGARRGAMPQGGARRGGMPAQGARGMQPQQQQGYGAPMDQPGMPFPGQRKKSNTGLIIGVVGGLLAVVLLVIIIAVNSGGEVVSEEDMSALRPVRDWSVGKPVPSQDVLDKADSIANSKGFENADDENLFRHKRNEIKTFLENQDIKEYNEKIEEYKNTARKSAAQVFNQVASALKARDQGALSALIDWNEYHSYLRGEGKLRSVQANFVQPGEGGTPFRSPSTHVLELEKKPSIGKDGKQEVYGPESSHAGKPKFKLFAKPGSQLRSLDDLKTNGLKAVMEFYDSEKLEFDPDKDKNDKGKMAVFGVPDMPYSRKALKDSITSKWLVIADFHNGFYTDENGVRKAYMGEGLSNEDLRVFVSGDWGSSNGTVVALLDRRINEWVKGKRDEAVLAEEAMGGGDDPWRKNLPNANGGNGGTGSNQHPSIPAVTYSDAETYSKTGAKMSSGPARSFIEKTIQDQELYSGNRKAIDAVKALSKADKVALFGYAVDLFVDQEAYQTPKDDLDSSAIRMAEFMEECVRYGAFDEVLSEIWRAYISANGKRSMNYKEYAWRCSKLYEAYKNRY